MLKKISLLILLIFIIPVSFAQNIELKDATTLANNFILQKKEATNFVIFSEQNITSKSGNLLAYVFELSPLGYIVVCADKSQIPVIAYSFKNSFSGFDSMGNPLKDFIQADLTHRFDHKNLFSKEQILKNQKLWNAILYKNKLKADTAFEQWPTSGSTTTEGWILTNWNQSAPYNNMCPMDLGTDLRSLSGCPSTAMAQIINYHATLNSTRFSDDDDYYHNYGSNQFWIDNDYISHDFPSFPQLNAYLDTLEDKYIFKAPVTDNDKAALIFACGVATKTVYSSSGSGTFGVDQAFDGFLRFDFSTCQLLDTGIANPYPQIISNIKDSLPVFLAVVDPAWNSGHNLVIDGYNTDDYYHLNFGWGGSYDGWYNIPSDLPFSLTVTEGVIVDIGKTIPANIATIDNKGQSIQLFPNPAQQFINILYFSKKAETSHIMLFDSYGSLVLEQQTKHESEKTNNIKINLENLRQGIYTYYVINQTESFTGKIIKL